MKIVRYILRILFTPVVFLLWLGMMSLFIGPFSFILGCGQLVGFFFKESNEDLLETLRVTFVWILVPIYSTYNFIKTGTIFDGN